MSATDFGVCCLDACFRALRDALGFASEVLHADAENEDRR